MSKKDLQRKINAPLPRTTPLRGGAVFGTSSPAPSLDTGLWDFSGPSLTGGNVVLHADGWAKFGFGEDIIQLDADNPDYRIWVGSEDPTTAPFRVTKEGKLEATGAVVDLAEIAGWNVHPDRLENNDAILSSDGYLQLGLGDNIVRLDAQNTTYRVWVGDANPALAPFSVTRVGNIYAEAGTIGGWSLAVNNLSQNDALLHAEGYLQLGTGNNIVRLDAQDASWRLWVGNADPTLASFRVHRDGTLVASGAVVNGEIEAVSGNIGGWSIDTDRIYHALSGNIGIELDVTGPDIKVGYLAGDHILLDGAAGTVGNSGFEEGVRGWQVDLEGKAEFLDAEIRGTLRTAIFERITTSVVGGSFFVARGAGSLDADYTVGGTMIIEGDDWAFATNDIVRIRAMHTTGFGDTWLTVTRQATVNHYSTAHQSGTSGVVYPSGTAVTNFGQAGHGFIHLSALDPHGPHIHLATHAGSPWSTSTLIGRLGNLRDSYGIGAVDTYGFAFGDYAANKYIRWNGTDLDIHGKVYVHPTVGTELADWTHPDDRTLIDGGDIFARSVTADRMTIQSGNYLENPDFMTGDETGWSLEAGADVVATAPNSGTHHMRMLGIATWSVRAYSTPIPAAAGSRWSAKAWVRTSSGTYGANLQVVFLDAGHGYLGLAHTIDDNVGTAYKLIAVDEATAPANTRYVQIRLAVRDNVPTWVYLYWDDIELQKADNALFITPNIKFNRQGVHILGESVWTGWGQDSVSVWTSYESGHQHTVTLYGHRIKLNDVWHIAIAV